MLYSDPSLPIPMWHSPVRRRTPNLQKSFSVDDMVSASYAVVLAPRVLMWFGRGFWPLAAGHENHTVIKLGRTTRMYGLNPYRSSTIGSHAAASCDCSIQQATSAHPSGLLGPMYSHINRKLFTLPRQLVCLLDPLGVGRTYLIHDSISQIKHAKSQHISVRMMVQAACCMCYYRYASGLGWDRDNIESRWGDECYSVQREITVLPSKSFAW